LNYEIIFKKASIKKGREVRGFQVYWLQSKLEIGTQTNKKGSQLGERMPLEKKKCCYSELLRQLFRGR